MQQAADLIETTPDFHPYCIVIQVLFLGNLAEGEAKHKMLSQVFAAFRL